MTQSTLLRLFFHLPRHAAKLRTSEMLKPALVIRQATPPRICPPEELTIQLELHGFVEHEWLAARGWTGDKLMEIVRLRKQVRAERLAELKNRLEEACEESDLAEKRIRRTSRASILSGAKHLMLGSRSTLQNQRLALKYTGDFKRARSEISELMREITALSDSPPNW
ncbi:hypothetical protein V5O48_019307, partial [Marasmius crinis-equi]